MDVSPDDDDYEDAWPVEYQDLRKLEKELRCPICGEFITTCLSLPDCLHSFCAVCIRRFLQTTAAKEVCPMCRAPTSSALLKPNPHLDTIVRSFSNCRTSVLTALRRTLAKQPSPCPSPPNKRTLSSPAAPSTSPPARVPPRRLRRTTAAVHTPIERVSILSDDEDEETAALDRDQCEGDEWAPGTSDFAAEPPNSSRRRRAASSILAGGSGAPNASKRSKQEEASTPSTTRASASEPDPPGKVRCPICSIPIFESLIQRHVEGCLVHTASTVVSSSKAGDGSGGSALTSKAAAPAQRKLPNLVYHMMKDKTLKAHLTKANLSTKGDRKALEARHREYTLQMNCLLDTGSRVDSAKVAAEVERAERQRALAESSTASLMQQHHNSQRNPNKRSDSFAELVHEVLRRKAQPSTAAALKQPAPSSERISNPHTIPEESTTAIPMAVGAADPVAAPGSDKGVRASSRLGERRGFAAKQNTDNSQADHTFNAAAEIVHEGLVPDHFDDDDDYPYELVSLSQAQPY